MAVSSWIVFTLVHHNVYDIMKTWLNSVIFSHNPSIDFQIVFHADTIMYGGCTMANSNVPILVLTLPIPVTIFHMLLAHLLSMEARGASVTLVT
jgi:hypothetical protein